MYLIDQCTVWDGKRQGAVDVAPFSAIFFIISRLLTRAISNLALQAIEKVPDVSLNSARCSSIEQLLSKKEQREIFSLSFVKAFKLLVF